MKKLHAQNCGWLRSLRSSPGAVAGGLLSSLLLASVLAAKAELDDDNGAPSLPAGCGNIAAPGGNELVFHAYAIGFQIYTWNGTSWGTSVPAAVLYGDAGYHGQVAIHFAGPTWESISGSKVVGSKIQSCTPDASAIPWLLLKAVSTSGPGVFNGVTYVQRLNTVGGKAPSAPGSFVGQVAQVPYTAEYFFYGASD